MKKLDILMVHDGADPLPSEKQFHIHSTTSRWNTEIAVYTAIKQLGHEIRTCAVNDDPVTLLAQIRTLCPDIVFNLAESCLGEYRYDQHVPSLLELAGVPYTGCGPMGLMLCNNKAITKKILVYHNISVPRFCVYHVGEHVQLPETCTAPYFIKPLQEEASTGIAQRSIAKNLAQCRERVNYIHEHLKMDALVEEYIDGRELYVSIFGHGRHLRVLPIWELKFGHMDAHEPHIATYQTKWNDAYRKKWGIRNEYADPLSSIVEETIRETCLKAYRVLALDGYARFDLRLTREGQVYIIEANANPELARGEDFAASAEKDGIPYEMLINKIMHLALHRNTPV